MLIADLAVAAPVAGPRMLVRLASETARHHKLVDAALYASLETASLGGYRYFLASIYGFQAALDCVLRATPGFDPAFLEPRLRAPALAADLMSLGLTRSECVRLARRPTIPRLARLPDALGWLYVTERLTLRHHVIRDRLLQRIPAVVLTAGEYLSTGRHARSGWRELGVTLDRACASAATASRTVAAADAAFTELTTWLTSVPPYDGF